MAYRKIFSFWLSTAFLLTLFSGVTVSNFPTRQANAADTCQAFPETGFSVCGRFLEYWKASGGLAQQGYPISNVFEEKNADPPAGDGKVHRVQYFQRARFEEHTENQPPYDVLLGLLGTEQVKAKYTTVPAPPQQPGTCQYFKETDLQVCGRFLEYWLANGGLTQQGFPITGVIDEQNLPPPAGDGKIHRVQYFQRARFEEHTENLKPFDVLLGLLGTEQYQAKYANNPTTGTPTPTPSPSPSPTPSPSPAPTTPASGGGGNCLPPVPSGITTLVQACVDNPNPAQHSTVTVYGRLIINGQPAASALMDTTWAYKTTASSCKANTGVDGMATCGLDIGRAASGFKVYIDVLFSYNGQTYDTNTGFTPQ